VSPASLSPGISGPAILVPDMIGGPR
jgi:hypothetical protein